MDSIGSGEGEVDNICCGFGDGGIIGSGYSDCKGCGDSFGYIDGRGHGCGSGDGGDCCGYGSDDYD